jgi:hypothetical protein
LPRPPAGPHAVEKPDLSKPRKNYSQSIAIADVRSEGGRLAHEQRALFVHWELDRKIEAAAVAHPDFFISESLPGGGAALAPRLLAAFGSQRERYANAEEVQAYTGIAPVTERSGKKKWAHFRWACPKFLRQSFHAWAGHSVAHSNWVRSYYQQQRERGKGHHAAVRGLAFKWIRIVFRCWTDRAVYDESKYLAALAKRNSPLAAVAGTILGNLCGYPVNSLAKEDKKTDSLLRYLFSTLLYYYPQPPQSV